MGTMLAQNVIIYTVYNSPYITIYVVLFRTVGRALRLQRQDSWFDSRDQPYVECMHAYMTKSLWIKGISYIFRYFVLTWRLQLP